jgi:hypothetical protein
MWRKNKMALTSEKELKQRIQDKIEDCIFFYVEENKKHQIGSRYTIIGFETASNEILNLLKKWGIIK